MVPQGSLAISASSAGMTLMMDTGTTVLMKPMTHNFLPRRWILTRAQDRPLRDQRVLELDMRNVFWGGNPNVM